MEDKKLRNLVRATNDTLSDEASELQDGRKINVLGISYRVMGVRIVSGTFIILRCEAPDRSVHEFRCSEIWLRNELFKENLFKGVKDV
jgi:hypothetical protein